MEIDTVLATARSEWAHSSHTRSSSVEDFMVRHLTRYVEDKLKNGDCGDLRKPGFTIWVPGEPAPWGMGKAVRGGRRLKPQRLQDWQDRVTLEWRRIQGTTQLSGPVSLSFVFHPTTHRTDLSNLVKGAEDALKDRAFGDDQLVYRIDARKMPASSHDEAGMEMVVAAHDGSAFMRHLVED